MTDPLVVDEGWGMPGSYAEAFKVLAERPAELCWGKRDIGARSCARDR